MRVTARVLGVAVLLCSGCSGLMQNQTEVVERGWLPRSAFNTPDLRAFRQGYDTSHVDPEFMTMLRTANPGVGVLVFLGTWCSDSRREVPRFLKIADSSGIPADSIRFYGLDRTKKSQDGLTDRYRIDKVPTFIFLKKGEEIGRITEAPVATLEGDMLSIFAGARDP